MHAKENLMNGCCQRIGDGKSTNLWDGHWLPYQGRFKFLTWKSLDPKVLCARDLIEQGNDQWNIPVIDEHLIPYDKERTLLVHIGRS